jgi:hypothetical protein
MISDGKPLTRMIHQDVKCKQRNLHFTLTLILCNTTIPSHSVQNSSERYYILKLCFILQGCELH